MNIKDFQELGKPSKGVFFPELPRSLENFLMADTLVKKTRQTTNRGSLATLAFVGAVGLGTFVVNTAYEKVKGWFDWETSDEEETGPNSLEYWSGDDVFKSPPAVNSEEQASLDAATTEVKSHEGSIATVTSKPADKTTKSKSGPKPAGHVSLTEKPKLTKTRSSPRTTYQKPNLSPRQRQNNPFFSPGSPAAAAAGDIAGKNYGKAATGLDDAITKTAKRTGVSSSLLYALAYKETRFGRIMNNTTSSAKGVFQHIPVTFNSLIKTYGKDYPELNAGPNNLVAAATGAALLLKEQHRSRTRRGKSAPNFTESYVLYLLGQRSGDRFIDKLNASPNRIAETDFGKEARANPSVFRSKGKPRTYKEVYHYLSREVGNVARGLKTSKQVALSRHRATLPPVTMKPNLIPKTLKKGDPNYDTIVQAAPDVAMQAPVNVDRVLGPGPKRWVINVAGTSGAETEEELEQMEQASATKETEQAPVAYLKINKGMYVRVQA